MGQLWAVKKSMVCHFVSQEHWSGVKYSLPFLSTKEMHPPQVNASPRSRVSSFFSNSLPQTVSLLATCQAFYSKYIPVNTGMSILALCWQSVDTEAANQSVFLQGWKKTVCLVNFVRTQNEHSTTICCDFSAEEMECSTPSPGLGKLAPSHATCPQRRPAF